ncbi:hypothetical protein BC827DRAFT_577887 [Russula dissimulans]|nr:hypothetical protein BC827DRAFT_577887 [Russula dissimulans]
MSSKCLTQNDATIYPRVPQGLHSQISPLQHTPNNPSSPLTFVFVPSPSTSRSVISTGTNPASRAARKNASRVYRPVCNPATRCARALRVRASTAQIVRSSAACCAGSQSASAARTTSAAGRSVDASSPPQACATSDGAVGARAVARHVLAERADRLCVEKVAGDDAYVWVALSDENARQARACTELYQAQGVLVVDRHWRRSSSVLWGGRALRCDR